MISNAITKQLRWLHLSDVHFRDKSKLDQNDAFTRIRADVKRRRSEGRGPDLVFVTGDITHSGQAADFSKMAERIDQLRDECGLSKNRVFFCPGNHDSDIEVAPVLLQGCWKTLTDISAFQRFMTTAEYAWLKERQAAYRTFVQSFRGDNRGFDSNELHAVHRVTLGSLDLGILSVNSAILAQGGASDHGYLQVCVRALEKSCAALRGRDLIIALIHHPFEWLAPFEADRAETAVLETADVVLRGHLHQPKLGGSLRDTILSAVGAMWHETACDYQYGFGCLTIDSLVCEIESVRYVQQTGMWMTNSSEKSLVRNRDERSTPASILMELRSGFTYPAQIAASLSGFATELMTTASGRPLYMSTEMILAHSLKTHDPLQPALGVIRVGTLLRFYGHDRCAEVIRNEMETLKAYDQALRSAASSDRDFKAVARAREQSANALTSTTSDVIESWSDRLLGRLVADGDVARISALRDEGASSLLGRLRTALASSRDPFEAWLAVGGPPLEFAELATIVTRLAVRATADLAALALEQAASRFPREAQHLDSLAKVIASELGDPMIHTKFRKAVTAS